MPNFADSLIFNNGINVGIGDATPASLFTVGSGDLFQVDLNGDLVRIKNITYGWPGAQGGADTYLRNNGAGSHLMMSNPSATGQNVVYSAINGNLVAKWRTDYAGNINWVSGRAGGKHYFFTGGDYGTGKIRMVIPDDGSAYIGGDIAESTWANASLAIKNGNVGLSEPDLALQWRG